MVTRRTRSRQLQQRVAAGVEILGLTDVLFRDARVPAGWRHEVGHYQLSDTPQRFTDTADRVHTHVPTVTGLQTYNEYTQYSLYRDPTRVLSSVYNTRYSTESVPGGSSPPPVPQ